MGKIIELPNDVVRRIAAGEVITRPVSVVKELMENSIDAGAKRVSVSIENGGKSIIDVVDDGEGMEEDDLLIAIKPHTTSKIRNFEDVYNLESFGFRGEALSSIVAVSETIIISKTRDSDLGTEISLRASEIISIRKVPFQTGTRIIVKNLFFNLPARRRFLSSSAVEGRMIGDLFQKFLLSLLGHHLIFIRDGGQIYNAPPTSDPLERILMVFPELNRNDMVEFENEINGFKVWGFASRIGKGLKTKVGQIFFVNRRYVRVPLLYKIVEKVVKDVPLDSQPYVILYLQIPGKFVDINIHPQKLEVDFSNPNLINDLVYNSLMKVYRSQKSVGKIQLEFDKSRGEKKVSRPVEVHEFTWMGEKREGSTRKVGTVQVENLRFLGMLGGRYAILVSLESEEEKLVIVDVHAGHERIIYEELKDLSRIGSQVLSFELTVHLDDTRLSVLKENPEILKKFGFEYEIAGKDMILKAIPKILPVSSVERTIIELLDELKLFGMLNEDEILDSIRRRIARISCSHALKTHDRMRDRDVMEIMKKLEKYGVKTCPHGRPIIMELSMRDLDRMFGRI